MKQNELALITGGTAGIGLGIARAFAAHGHPLLLVARNEQQLADIAAELEQLHKVTVHTFSADLTDAAAPQAIFRFAKEQGLELRYLVNNAGFGNFGKFTEAEWPTDAAMIQLNIVALTQLSKLFAQYLIARKQPGRILQVASTAAYQPGPMVAVYSATKAYVHSLAGAMANELAEHNISVTSLCPGPTDTDEVADMADTFLFRLLKLPHPDKVGAFGYKSLMAGDEMAVMGLSNKLTIFGSKLLPSKWRTALAGKLLQ